MAGPFGIDQVDVPGVMGNVANMQFNRVRMMMAQKQLEMFERQSGALKAISDAYNGAPSASDTSGASSPQSAPAAPSGAPTASDIAQPAAATPAAASTTPAAPAGMPAAQSYIPSDAELARRRQIAGAVSSFSPEMAGQMIDNFGKMDAQQLAAVQQRNQRIAQIEAGILQLPYAQRKQAIQANMGEFQQMGYNPQQLASFDPSDENIRGEIAKHLDVDHLMTMVTPHFENMRAGGAVSETQPYGASSIVAQSPIVAGPKGAVYPLPNSVNANPSAMTATNPKTGEKVQSIDGGKTWQPLGGQTPPASGGFPQ